MASTDFPGLRVRQFLASDKTVNCPEKWNKIEKSIKNKGDMFMQKIKMRNTPGT